MSAKGKAGDLPMSRLLSQQISNNECLPHNSLTNISVASFMGKDNGADRKKTLPVDHLQVQAQKRSNFSLQDAKMLAN